MASDLIPLFQPKSVALIGASSDTKKYGYWTAKSLYENGFKGDIYLVNKKGEEILGHKSYTDILSCPGPVDLAIIAIAPKYIVPIIEQCVQKGVKVGIVVSTGFGETGEEGKSIEKEMLEVARKGGMRIMGPNCMGMYSAKPSLNASIIDLAPGPMSLVLQSGNFGIDLNIGAKKRGMGYSCWATIGNQMDIRFQDFVRYMKEDEATRCLLLYMEGLRVESEADGRNFIEAARSTCLEKPITAIKIGRSAAGARAAASHTGSLAGSEKIFDAALRQSGVVRVDTPQDLLDAAEAFAKCKPAKGKRIAVLTDGGGHGVMATDFCEKYNMEAPVLSEATRNKLLEILPARCPIKNPVDLAGTPEADMWVFDRCLDVLLNDPDIDGVVIVGLYGGYCDLSEEFRKLEMDVAVSMADRIAKADKPVVMHSIYQPMGVESLQFISDHGVPVFGSVDEAVRTMGTLVEYARLKKQVEEDLASTPPAMPADRKKHAQNIIDIVRNSGRVNFVETEARELLRAYGVNIAPTYLATSREEAAKLFENCNGKAVMKIVSPDILHKTDAGGVILNIDSPEKAMEAYDKIMKSCLAYKADAEIYGILLTEQLPSGVECIIGSSYDSTFGPTVMFGLGGIFVEVLKDVAFRVAPINKPSADRMITEIRGLGMLKGARGSKPCDLDALANAVSVISHMVTELDDIAEVDMNPVFALENGLAVADARIVLKAK